MPAHLELDCVGHTLPSFVTPTYLSWVSPAGRRASYPIELAIESSQNLFFPAWNIQGRMGRPCPTRAKE